MKNLTYVIEAGVIESEGESVDEQSGENECMTERACAEHCFHEGGHPEGASRKATTFFRPDTYVFQNRESKLLRSTVGR